MAQAQSKKPKRYFLVIGVDGEFADPKPYQAESPAEAVHASMEGSYDVGDSSLVFELLVPEDTSPVGTIVKANCVLQPE